MNVGQTAGMRMELLNTVLPAQSKGRGVNSGTTANTMSAWHQISAALPATYDSVVVVTQNFTSGTRAAMFEFGIGLAGFEVPIAGPFQVDSWTAYNAVGRAWELPIRLPQGNRLAMRLQHDQSVEEWFHFCVYGVRKSPFSTMGGYRKIASIGDNQATSQGLTMDTGAVANTKTAWIEMNAGTDDEYDGLLLFVDCDNDDKASNGRQVLDIAIGAAASEEVIAADLQMTTDSSADNITPTIFEIHTKIPRGSRVAYRAQSQLTSASDRIFNITLLGFAR